jgi:hypothetical protein
MCFSKRLSILSFIVGIVSSAILIKFGEEQYKKSNEALGYFFMFVSCMQLIEFFLWIDQNPPSTINKISSILGPIFNNLQPIVALSIGKYFIEDSINPIHSYIIYGVSIVYVIYVIYTFIEYIQLENMYTTTNKEKHLDWKWKYHFSYRYYYIVMLIIFSRYYDNKYIWLSTIISFAILFFSVFKFSKNIGELWCFMVTGVPLMLFVIQKFLK